MPKRKILKARIADDLIRKIFKAEGWVLDRQPRVRRCNELYTITADPCKNVYIATPKDEK